MSALQHIIQRFEHALKELDARFVASDVEKLGFLVDEAMSGPNRSFHTSQHIFDILMDDDPIRTLAVLFHDVVYNQVDHGVSEKIARLIKPFVRFNDHESELAKLNKEDFCYEASKTLFDFQPGKHKGQLAGLNEFLSCLTAMKSLEPFLQKKDLVKIGVCIEATIPFRSAKEQHWLKEMKTRLKKIEKKWALGFKEKDLNEALRSAVIVSNWDVSNFAEEEVGHFLDNTWKIIMEGNSSLVSQKIYTVKDYRVALERMEHFFHVVKAENIHHQFLDYPSNKEFGQLISKTKRNLRLGRQYLGAKLLTIVIIEALALETGGDVPISLFMGDQSAGDEENQKFKKWLPLSRNKRGPTFNSEILELLEGGRATQSEFDSKAAQLSAFIYKSLGKARTEKLTEKAKKMAEGKINPEAFLKLVPENLLSPIAKACAEIAPTRKEELLKVV